MIIAIDFDGTLSHEQLFDDMSPNLPLIGKLIRVKEKGHELILWTCRGGEWLDEAVNFCNSYGLFFNAVNENVKGRTYTNLSCKVVADLYVDDKAPGSIKYFLDKKF